MYADDTTLGASATTLPLVVQKLISLDAAKVEKWCENNRMAINTE